jgi:hypothetical protein
MWFHIRKNRTVIAMASEQSPVFQLTVKTLAGQLVEVSIAPSQSVLALKKQVETAASSSEFVDSAVGWAVDRQRLFRWNDSDDDFQKSKLSWILFIQRLVSLKIMIQKHALVSGNR